MGESPLDRLRSVVTSAEQAARSEELDQVRVDARKELEAVSRIHEQASAHCLDVRSRFEMAQRQIAEERGEVALLEKRAVEYQEFVEEDVDYPALIEQTRADLDRRESDFVAELRAAEEDARVARERLNRAEKQFEEACGSAATLDDISETTVTIPRIEIDRLGSEIDDAMPAFGMLTREEQHSQLCIWGGRARKIQDGVILSEDEKKELFQVFGRVRTLHGKYQPGWIDALNRKFTTEWDAYIREHQEKLEFAIDEVHTKRIEQREQHVRERERTKMLRKKELIAREAMDRLQELAGQTLDTEESVRGFQQHLIDILEVLPASDPELLSVVSQQPELIRQGQQFRALRRQLQKAGSAGFEEVTVVHRHQEALEVSRGRRAVLIGGAPREERRVEIERVFEFSSLDWESCEGNEPQKLARIAERVKNGSLDLVIQLVSFVGHHVGEAVRPACQSSEVPFVLVPRGYGVNQVAEALADQVEKTD